MRSKSDAADNLDDIIANAACIERYLADLDLAAFGADDMARDAVKRCLERICEAGHRLTDLAAKLIPGHPWDDIRGMGNQLRRLKAGTKRAGVT